MMSMSATSLQRATISRMRRPATGLMTLNSSRPICHPPPESHHRGRWCGRRCRRPVPCGCRSRCVAGCPLAGTSTYSRGRGSRAARAVRLCSRRRRHERMCHRPEFRQGSGESVLPGPHGGSSSPRSVPGRARKGGVRRGLVQLLLCHLQQLFLQVFAALCIRLLTVDSGISRKAATSA